MRKISPKWVETSPDHNLPKQPQATKKHLLIHRIHGIARQHWPKYLDLKWYFPGTKQKDWKWYFAPLCFSSPPVHQGSQPGSKWSRIRRWRPALPYLSVWLCVYHSVWLCRTDTYESGGPGTLPYRFVEIFRFKIKYSIIQVYFRQAHDTFSGTKTRLEICISLKICDLISTELLIVGKEVVSSNIPISCKRGMMQFMIFVWTFSWAITYLRRVHMYMS